MKNWFKILIFFFYLIIIFYLFRKSSVLGDQVNYNAIILIIFFHFFIFIFFLFKKKIYEFILLNLAVFFTLCLVELYLFYKQKNIQVVNTKNILKLRMEAAKKSGKTFDNTNIYELIQNARNQNKDIRLGFNWLLKNRQEFLIAQKELKTKLIPLTGPMNKIIVSGNEDGVYKYYKHDKYGFKNPNSRYESDIDTILIGDSFVYAGSYDNNDDIAGQLTNKYNLNSLNFGLVGTSFLSHYSVIQEYAIELKPKNIILFYYEGNDLPELTNELKEKFLLKYLEGIKQNLIKNNENSKELIELYQKKRFKTLFEKTKKKKSVKVREDQKYTIISFIKLQKLRKLIGIHNLTLPEFNIQEFNNMLFRINRITNKENIRVIFVYLPSWLRYNNYYGYQSKQLSYKKNIIGIASKYFEIMDMSDLMKKNPNAYFPFGLYGHFNLEGLTFVSEKIFDKINDK